MFAILYVINQLGKDHDIYKLLFYYLNHLWCSALKGHSILFLFLHQNQYSTLFLAFRDFLTTILIAKH